MHNKILFYIYKIYRIFLEFLNIVFDNLIGMLLKLSNDRVKFNIIYKTSFWANRAKESYSLSGEGSSIEATQSIRKNLPVFIKDTNYNQC